MILVDTSAWVEFDRASESAVDLYLTGLIRAGGEQVAVSEPILMEVLAGARDDHRHRDLRRLLTSFNWISTDPVADFEGAAGVYRACRAAGITPRGLVDCMIMSIALRTGSALLSADRDLAQMSAVLPLDVVSP